MGDSIRARAPDFAEWVCSFSNIGIRNAAVFPLPVLAMATMSLPSIITGMVWKKDDKKHENHANRTPELRQISTTGYTDTNPFIRLWFISFLDIKEKSGIQTKMYRVHFSIKSFFVHLLWIPLMLFRGCSLSDTISMIYKNEKLHVWQ